MPIQLGRTLVAAAAAVVAITMVSNNFPKVISTVASNSENSLKSRKQK